LPPDDGLSLVLTEQRPLVVVCSTNPEQLNAVRCVGAEPVLIALYKWRTGPAMSPQA